MNKVKFKLVPVFEVITLRHGALFFRQRAEMAGMRELVCETAPFKDATVVVDGARDGSFAAHFAAVFDNIFGNLDGQDLTVVKVSPSLVEPLGIKCGKEAAV